MKWKRTDVKLKICKHYYGIKQINFYINVPELKKKTELL